MIPIYDLLIWFNLIIESDTALLICLLICYYKNRFFGTFTYRTYSNLHRAIYISPYLRNLDKKYNVLSLMTDVISYFINFLSEASWIFRKFYFRILTYKTIIFRKISIFPLIFIKFHIIILFWNSCNFTLINLMNKYEQSLHSFVQFQGKKTQKYRLYFKLSFVSYSSKFYQSPT